MRDIPLRQRKLVVCAFSENEQAFSAPGGFDLASAKLILQNYPDAPERRLRPYECRVYLWDKQAAAKSI